MKMKLFLIRIMTQTRQLAPKRIYPTIVFSMHVIFQVMTKEVTEENGKKIAKKISQKKIQKLQKKMLQKMFATEENTMVTEIVTEDNGTEIVTEDNGTETKSTVSRPRRSSSSRYTIYKKEQLPEKWKYRHNERVAPIVVVAQEGVYLQQVSSLISSSSFFLLLLHLPSSSSPLLLPPNLILPLPLALHLNTSIVSEFLSPPLHCIFLRNCLRPIFTILPKFCYHF